MGWAVLLFVMFWIAIGMFVQVAHKPQLDAHTAMFLWIILAMLLRILADSYHFALFCPASGRITVTVNLAGAAGSALLNALLVPTLGLAGAVIASLLTAAGLLFSRFLFSRPSNTDGASDRPGAGPSRQASTEAADDHALRTRPDGHRVARLAARARRSPVSAPVCDVEHRGPGTGVWRCNA